MPRRVSSISAATRARASPSVGIVEARAMARARRGSTARRSAARRRAAGASISLDALRGTRAASHGAPQEGEVERQLAARRAPRRSRRDLGGFEQVDLADHRALAVAVEQAAPAADDVVHLGVVLVVDVLLAEVVADRVLFVRIGRRVVAQLRVLDHLVDDVDAEAVDAALEPEARSTSSIAATTAGLRQFRSGCSARNECR